MTKIKELENELRITRRNLTDAMYMIEHLHQMLGPKGREVVKMWADTGVQRIHVSWGPDAASISGEEIAQLHLDIHEACKDAVPMTREELERF